MDNTLFWSDLKGAFGSQKVFWTGEENDKKPDVTDRLIHYIISYYENSSVARESIRAFKGLNLLEFDLIQFSSWSEVRVATLREIDDILKVSGASGDSWELAITIKDFLENAWNTLHTVDLGSVPLDERAGYLLQLQSKGTWGKQTTKEEKNKPCPAPFRPDFSIFHKHCSRYRKQGERVIPSCAIGYLEFLWNRTRNAPYENHANRILSRVGVFLETDSLGVKISKFETLLTSEKPIGKHKNLVQLGKMVCFSSNPRCGICPIAKHCSKVGVS